MTGYARDRLKFRNYIIDCELKSYNHRYIQTRITLHPEIECYDYLIENFIKENVKRGYVIANIQILRSDQTPVIFIPSKFGRIYSEIARYTGKFGRNLFFTYSDYMDLYRKHSNRAVIPFSSLKTLLGRCVAELYKMRSSEGKKTLNVIQKKVKRLEALNGKISKMLPWVLSEYRKKITDTLGLDAETAAKSQLDINQLTEKALATEEVDRIRFHIEKLSSLIRQPGLIGKKLGFLAQELLRETNTLASKVSSPQIQYHCVEMKDIIDDLREQSENIE